MTPRQPTRTASKNRWWIWSPLLALALWLALFGDKSPAVDSGISQATRAVAATTPSASPTTTLRAATVDPAALTTLRPRAELVSPTPPADAISQVAGRDLFAAHNWTPPPAAAVSAPAAPPSAPALPYVYLGKKQETEVWEIYLGRGEQSFIAREGQVLEGMYRVDKIEPPSLLLTYLPLNQSQTLSIGESR